MSYHFYDRPEAVPKAIDDRMVFDSTTCEVGICCGEHRTAIGGYLTVDPETDGDRPTWSAFCAIRGVGETDEQAVLCCEDCAGWLKDAILEPGA